MAASVSDIAIKISADTNDAVRQFNYLNKAIKDHERILKSTKEGSRLNREAQNNVLNLRELRRQMGANTKQVVADSAVYGRTSEKARYADLARRGGVESLNSVLEHLNTEILKLIGTESIELDTLKQKKQALYEVRAAYIAVHGAAQNMGTGLVANQTKVINWSMAASQASYAADDFFATISTMGAVGAMRGAGNNLSQMARILSPGVSGSIYGAIVGITIGVLPMLINMFNKVDKEVEKSTSRLKSWKNVLDSIETRHGLKAISKESKSERKDISKIDNMDDLIVKQKELLSARKDVTDQYEEDRDKFDARVRHITNTLSQSFTDPDKSGRKVKSLLSKIFEGDPEESDRITKGLKKKIADMTDHISETALDSPEAFQGALEWSADEIEKYLKANIGRDIGERAYHALKPKFGGLGKPIVSPAASAALKDVKLYNQLVDTVLGDSKKLLEAKNDLNEQEDKFAEFGREKALYEKQITESMKAQQQIKNQMAAIDPRGSETYDELSRISMNKTQLFMKAADDEFAIVDEHIMKLRGMGTGEDFVGEELNAKLAVTKKLLAELRGDGGVPGKGGFTTQLESFQGALSAAASARDQIEKAKGDKDDIKRSALIPHFDRIVNVLESAQANAVTVGSTP